MGGKGSVPARRRVRCFWKKARDAEFAENVAQSSQRRARGRCRRRRIRYFWEKARDAEVAEYGALSSQRRAIVTTGSCLESEYLAAACTSRSECRRAMC